MPPKIKPLSEQEFVQYFLTEKLTWQEQKIKYGVSRDRFYSSLKCWRPKYADALRAISSARYSAAAKIRKKHYRDPKIILSREILQEVLAERLPIETMAAKLNVSVFILQRNIQYHGLQDEVLEPLAPMVWRRNNREQLEALEYFSPGISEAASKLRSDPAAFFYKLYDAHLKLLETAYFVNQLGKAHGRYYSKTTRKDVCWSMNRYEALLAIALREKGIPHQRQVIVGPTGRGPLLADFLVKGILYVELDGGFHAIQKQMENDRKKEEFMRESGIPLLRLPSDLLVKDRAKAVAAVENTLSLIESPLWKPTEWKQFGI